MEKNCVGFVQGKTDPFEKIARVLEKAIRGGRKENFTSIFAIAYPALLREASMEQIRQTLRASTTASDVRVRE